MNEHDKQRLQELQEKFAQLGWLPREDIEWLLAAMAQLLKK